MRALRGNMIKAGTLAFCFCFWVWVLSLSLSLSYLLGFINKVKAFAVQRERERDWECSWKLANLLERAGASRLVFSLSILSCIEMRFTQFLKKKKKKEKKRNEVHTRGKPKDMIELHVMWCDVMRLNPCYTKEIFR